ncbi:hypothetical protein B0H14DRAFT_80589 [Mycena olivaceomarginata]|nr:hypothetical protein B0H14DRAFT_80589 [Mycena olivaceomarginata]
MVSARYTPTLSEEIRGRYILAPREGSIELWNVNGMMPIWTRSSDLQAVPAFEVAGSGRSKAVQSFFSPACFSSIRVDDNLLHHELPPNWWTDEGGQFTISGDLVASVMYWYTTSSSGLTPIYVIMLVNWGTQKYVLIWHPDPYRFAVSSHGSPYPEATSCWHEFHRNLRVRHRRLRVSLGFHKLQSDIFGLQKWPAPAPNGLYWAGAWIWVGSHAHARPNGLQAILLAWQAILLAWHQPKFRSTPNKGKFQSRLKL